MKILLVTPPLTQLNTPYPATCQLKGFLSTQGIEAVQMDLSIELIQSLFTSTQLEVVFHEISILNKLSRANRVILQQVDFYIKTIDSVMRFLREK